MNLEFIDKDDLLVICPIDYKNSLLDILYANKKIIKINFMSLEEYKKNYFFDYGIDAIKYLTDNKNISVSNAKELLNNLYYVGNKQYGINKLDKLVEYKNELEEKGLLIKNELFNNYISNKNVVVAGYGKLNNFDKNIIKGKTVEFIEDIEIDKKYQIHVFDDIEQEVEYVYNSIADLLISGVDINNIYLMNVSDDYETYIKRFNDYYGFIVNYDKGIKLIGTTLGKLFVKWLNELSREEIYKKLTAFNLDASNELIHLLNKYAGYEISDIKEQILYDLGKITLKNSYKNVVECISVNSSIGDEDYVFLVGFNDKTPHTKVDNEYITDNVRSLVGLPLIEEENELIKANTRTNLSNIKNLTISYCKSNPFNNYNEQILLSKEKIEYVYDELSIEYSEKLNKVKYASLLDKLRKFNVGNEDLNRLYKAYGEDEYLSYNNKFKGLSDEQVINLTNVMNTGTKKDPNKLTLSYSSMNDFYKCNFKYYLQSILRLNQPFGTYYTTLGTVCHGVLEDLYNEDIEFDFDASWNKYVNQYEEDNHKKAFEDGMEVYYAQRVKEELVKDVEIIKNQKVNSLLTDQKCENNFTFEVTDRINFTGFIDKLMYRIVDDVLYACIVDYKTSKSINVNRKLMDYGLSLQLPSYLYLMSKTDKFEKDVKFIGFYLQHLINNNRDYDENETLEDKKNKSMKLDGFSSNDISRLSYADINLTPKEDSKNIGNVHVNVSGDLKQGSRLLSDEDFDELVKLIDGKVKDAGKEILAGDFKINPKNIDGKNESCEYCEFAPICYKRFSDLVFINTNKEEQ